MVGNRDVSTAQRRPAAGRAAACLVIATALAWTLGAAGADAGLTTPRATQGKPTPPRVTRFVLDDGFPTASWTLPRGAKAEAIEIAKAPSLDPDGSFATVTVTFDVLKPRQTSWKDDWRVPPGLYYVHVQASYPRCSSARCFGLFSAVRKLVVAAGSARAPVLASVGQTGGRISARWSLRPGLEAMAIELATKPDTRRDGAFETANLGDMDVLKPSQTSWAAASEQPPGTYYVHVSASDAKCVECPPVVYSNVMTVVVPPTAGSAFPPVATPPTPPATPTPSTTPPTTTPAPVGGPSTPANRPPQFPTQTVTSHVQDSYAIVNGAPRLSGETVTISLSSPATDADGDSLTYAWSATSGTIVGSGTTATWTRSVSGGALVPGTATVTASDGRGGTATYTIR